MKPRANNSSPDILKLAIISLLLCLIFIPAPALSEETYQYERMWPVMEQPWYFYRPYGVSVDKDGFIYVTDSQNDRIKKFTADGDFVTQWGKLGTGQGDLDIPCGIATDSQGFVYVADSQNSRIQKFTLDGEFVTEWGTPGAEDGEFAQPYGIAVSISGDVYVTDTSNSTVQKFSSSGQFLTKWGTKGNGDGEFDWPYGISVDKDGFVYVADSQNNRIQKFGKDGEFMGKWGIKGTGDGEFDWPVGITTDADGFLYVTDMKNHRVQKFTANGEFLTQWGKGGVEDGDFDSPDGIAVDESGFVYVADSKNDRIQKFTQNGQFAARWGRGVSDGELNSPEGIATDSEGNIYVTDSGNHRIQKFNEYGELETQWGNEGSEDGELIWPNRIAVSTNGHVYVADTWNDRIQKFSSDGRFLSKWGNWGTGDGEFDIPYGIAVCPNGHVYVVDMGNNRIQEFDSDGSFMAKWGSEGDGDGEFKNPYDIAVSISGEIYVADTGNHRIQKFSKNREFLAKWGEEGTDDGEFNLPYGLSADSDGFVYVVDSGNHRIQKFSIDGTFITKWGEEGSYPGQLKYPGACVAAPNGNFYITDTHNHRIQIFKMVPPLSQKAIIISGGGPYPGNHLWPATQMNANFAHRTLSYQGITKENIYYLSSDTDLDIDNNGQPDDIYGEPTEENLREVIEICATEDTESLIIYLVDHGEKGIFLMNGETNSLLTLHASTLNEYMENFPAEVILIYDACKSGSFLSDLTCDENRLLITSAAHNENAHFLNQGTLSFSNIFWRHIFNGTTIQNAFDSAAEALGNITKFQVPRIKVTGDISPDKPIGNGTIISDDPPVIRGMPDISISNTSSAHLFASDVRDDDGIARVWAVIIPPGYTGGISDSTVLELPFINLMPAGEDRYEGMFNKFNLEGTYQIAIYARDRRGNTSDPKTASVSVTHPIKRKAIIVAGETRTEDEESVVRTNTSLAYNALRTQGYPDEDICFMGPDSSRNGWDMTASVSHLQDALISEEMRRNTQDVVLYIVGSGDSEDFYLNETETLLTASLDAWLDALQESLPGVLTVIYEGNHAQELLPLLTPRNEKKRIVISSPSIPSTPSSPSTPGDTPKTKPVFWNNIKNGINLRDAFLNAKESLKSDPPEIPQLDDTGNGIGNEPGDGQVAMNHTIGIGIRLVPDTGVPQVTPCESDVPDVYETDDTREQSKVISDEAQCRNFHEPGDEDWLTFYGLSGKFYTIDISQPGINCNPLIELYDNDGNLLHTHDTPLNPTANEIWDWECPGDGHYFVKIRQADPDAFGRDTDYSLKIYQLIGPFPGYIRGSVSDAVSGAPIDMAVIITNANEAVAAGVSHPDGKYLIPHEPGTFTMTAEAEGYEPATYPDIIVSEGETANKDISLEPLPRYHSADYNPANYQISLTELLRIIQLYNSDSYHCGDPETEDGYGVETGNLTCTPHDSDYNPQNWRIGLSELLRVIQFYNASGYHEEPGEEDGFASGN